MRLVLLLVAPVFAALFTAACTPSAIVVEPAAPPPEPRLRLMTWNIEDVRTADVLRSDHPRLRAAARLIHELGPDVLLVQEMTYDMPGTPGFVADEGPGQNGRRFADRYLRLDAPGGGARGYDAWMPAVNTGLPSGFDLNDDGVVGERPAYGPDVADGEVRRQSAAERAYGNDAWGFGVIPGQYGMALFVRDGIEILRDSIRTFRLLPWRQMPGAQPPLVPGTDSSFYSPDEWAAFRLSSKTHADVPVRLPGGRIVHLLLSHPTPPAFDGPEQRNHHRNRDEIALWRHYIDGAEWIVDDAGRRGGLAPSASFVIMGDLNADPDEGDALGDPIGRLMAHPRVAALRPEADSLGRARYPDIDPDDTAGWGLGVDYVLPSADLRVLDAGVARPDPAIEPAVSDHFPVWIDIDPTR